MLLCGKVEFQMLKRVIPLVKKGKWEDIDNYRPISILPTVSKLLERAVHL